MKKGNSDAFFREKVLTENKYARLALDGEMQAWVDAIDSLDVW